MANTDMDDYTKTLNHRNILRKTQKNKTLPKTERTPKQKPELSGGQYLLLACQGRFAPLPLSVTRLVAICCVIFL